MAGDGENEMKKSRNVVGFDPCIIYIYKQDSVLMEDGVDAFRFFKSLSGVMCKPARPKRYDLTK